MENVYRAASSSEIWNSEISCCHRFEQSPPAAWGGIPPVLPPGTGKSVYSCPQKSTSPCRSAAREFLLATTAVAVCPHQSRRVRKLQKIIANETLCQLSYTPLTASENYHDAKICQQGKRPLITRQCSRRKPAGRPMLTPGVSGSPDRLRPAPEPSPFSLRATLGGGIDC